MRCEQCGHELPSGAKFCMECGAPVSRAAAPEAAEPEAAPLAKDADALPPEPSADDLPTARLAAAAAPVARAGETTPLDGPLASVQGVPQETGPVFPVEATSVAARVPEPAEPAQPAGPAQPKAPSARLGLLAAAVLFLAAVGLLAAFVTWRMELWGGKTLPDVVGMPQQEAVAELARHGFKAATREVVSDDAVGDVVTQDPDGDRRVEPGSVVALGIGVERAVPDVEGMGADEAREALKQRGIERLRLEYQNSDEPEGTVISVSPSAGTVVKADEMVTLVVAQPFTVPDVEGLEVPAAEDAVAQAGLASEVVYVSSDKPAGTVVSSDPGAGTTLKEGSVVKLNVSSPYPASLYAAADYLSCKPEDLSDYLRQEGYRPLYGSVRDGAALMTWQGPEAAPTVVVGPNPFDQYLGFQFWATDGLAAGAAVQGVRLEMSQKSAPAEVGALKPDQACVSRIMNACGLSSAPDTTTTASPATIEPALGASTPFAAKAGTMGDDTWAVVVYETPRAGTVAAVCVAPTDTLNENLAAQGIELGAHGGSMANLAASRLLSGR